MPRSVSMSRTRPRGAALRRPPGRLAPKTPRRSTAVDDSAVLASETMQIFDAAPEPKQLWLVPGDHMAICRLWGEAYRSRVGAFIGSVLGAPEAGEGA